ncbi:uncharacterized protein LOC141617596 [Silene latifolia]|uniref:uncharacterized protein LOC141617596 n=1 Tax=Silene latifolia TaxID=37657 RepID=UPI003D76D543
MHYLNKTKKGTVSYAALKLDMHKAFDRVSWPFLIVVLKKFGFPIFWQNIIWECISTVTYNILINGEPSATFRPSCGLRQGDPLSPYLFILCMEILSSQLRAAAKAGSIHGIKISRYAPHITHLFYVDDVFICCKATPGSFEVLRDLFRFFELASGQMINLDKSFIKFSPNAPPDFKSHMASILKIKTSTCFGNYLGVPVDLPSKKSVVFQPLVDKMTTRIIAWSSLHLSQPSFWWRKDIRHRSIHWLSRDSLQLPRENGGLDVKSVSLLSQASLMKNFWRIHHQPSGLLAKFMIPKYKKDLPIPALRSKVFHPSFLWAGLCRAASAFSPALSWKLGNGVSVDLLRSRWINGNIPSVRPSFSAASPVLSTLLTSSGNWNHSAVFHVFESPCAKIIISMEPPHIDIDDFLYWKFTKDGVYTVRSGNSFLLSRQSFSYSPSFYSLFPWKVLWGIQCSPKLPLLVWRIVHNILPSLDNLSLRGIQIIYSALVLLLDMLLSSALGLNFVANLAVSLQRWLADHIVYFHRLKDNSDCCLLHFLCVIKAIWMVRNSVVFEDCNVNPVQILYLSTPRDQFIISTSDSLTAAPFVHF